MAYNYRCLDGQDRVQEGLLNAATAEAARQDLEARGWRVLQIRQAQAVDAGRLRTWRRALRQERKDRELAFEEKVRTTLAPPEPDGGAAPPEAPPMSLKSMSVFMLQFRALLGAGLPIHTALAALARTEDPTVRATCANLLYQVDRGASLSQAMALNPRAFGPVVVNMTLLGERGGILVEVLGRLGSALDKEMVRRHRLAGALVYPAFVLAFSLALVGYLLYAMVPRFLRLFAETGMEMPWLTRTVMDVATSPVLPLAVVGVAAVGAAWTFTSRRTEAGRVNVQKLRYETPLVGPFFRDFLLARLCRDLGLLLRCGHPLSAALQLLAKPTTGYYRMDEALAVVHEGIYHGGLSLADAMRPLALFPPLLVQFVQTGEDTGGLDDFLDRFADLTDQRLDLAMSSFLLLLEPAMMLVLGVLVGTLVLAAFLPVYQLVTAL